VRTFRYDFFLYSVSFVELFVTYWQQPYCWIYE
jgi:hypothetical protein